MNAYITLKLMNGEYKNIPYSAIENVFINTLGEKTVFFKEGDELNYGFEVEVKDFPSEKCKEEE